EAAARALARAADRAAWLRRPQGRIRPLAPDRAEAQSVVDAALAVAGDAWLPADAARRLVSTYGVPFVVQRLVGSRAEATAAAEALGYPLAVKSGEAGVPKTDAGGVVLDVAD